MKEGNALFNEALNTFYLRLYDIGHMVKDQSHSEKENPLQPHGLLFPIKSGQVSSGQVRVFRSGHSKLL